MQDAQILYKSAGAKTPANAYLISCPSISESDKVIRRFLELLYCEKGTGCGICAACRKIKSESHVDFMKIDPPSDTIKLEDVFEVPEFISKKPFEANHKCVYIPDAGRLTVQSQNFLLKSIEEPKANAVFLLSVRNRNTILKTIVSRCVPIDLNPTSRNELGAELVTQGVPLLKARVIASMSGGFSEEAHALMANPEFDRLREDICGVCDKICAARGMAVTGMVETLLGHEQELGEAILIMLGFFRDVEMYKLCGDTELLINLDRKNDIKRYSERFTTAALHNMIEIIMDHYEKKQTCKGINNRLMLMAMLFKILEVKLNVDCNRSPV